MQGRTPSGIACVFGNCGEPGKEAELDRWYTDVHIPDVTAPGIFTLCTRFENPAAEGTAASPRYLAVYETDWEDPAAAWTENRKHTAPLREQGRIHPAMKASMVAIMKRLGQPAGQPGSRKTTGILAVLADCTDPAREDEFNRWYDGTHLGDVIGTGLYFAATRYVNTGLTEGQPKYLALYETDRADPVANAKELLGGLGDLARQGRMIDCIKPALLSPFALTYSLADVKAGAPR